VDELKKKNLFMLWIWDTEGEKKRNPNYLGINWWKKSKNDGSYDRSRSRIPMEN
jgi:hypothetical protein